MKYPFIIFYRKDKYNNIDNFFIENAHSIDFTVFIANCAENVNCLHDSNFQILVTYGDSFEEYVEELLSVVSTKMLVRHMHLTAIDTVDKLNITINDAFIKLCLTSRENVRPTFSLFTPAFNSYDKIIRVYNSLKNQTLKDWEWIIVDDSPDDAHFNFLRSTMMDDPRIRLYRRSKNNGSIGNVKNESIGLCRGKYVLEMDHDDEILPFVLKESAELFDKDTSIGFIYMDCACVYENGLNQTYGDFICKGYGAYYSQKYKDKWRLVYITPNINNITLSHLTCCPNHPRIWRRKTLMELDSYCEYLPICDDYEIILKTCVSTKVAKIHKLGYIQYMNDSNNNFSLIRNAEINRIGPNYISPIYYECLNIHETMKQFDAYEDPKYIHEHSNIWRRDTDTYVHKHCNLIVNSDYDCQYCIIGFDSLLYHLDLIKQLYENPRNDFFIIDNKCSLDYLCQRIEKYGFDKMKCYTLPDVSDNLLVNYFKMLYLSVPEYKILNVNIQRILYNSEMEHRHDAINMETIASDIYLEIGVEYGSTFLNTHFTYKIGVDPDPKVTTTNEEFHKCTSDEYFAKISLMNNVAMYDAIFIDGMHQTEYFLKDVNNAIKYISETGKIFIDDILPFNYNEQLKIPINHYYEHGVLKYGENWTGDIWKVVYHILLLFSDNIQTFKYYYNINYRGIAVIQLKHKFQINETDINIINNYTYFTDFSNYTKLVELTSSKFSKLTSS